MCKDTCETDILDLHGNTLRYSLLLSISLMHFKHHIYRCVRGSSKVITTKYKLVAPFMVPAIGQIDLFRIKKPKYDSRMNTIPSPLGINKTGCHAVKIIHSINHIINLIPVIQSLYFERSSD